MHVQGASRLMDLQALASLAATECTRSLGLFAQLVPMATSPIATLALSATSAAMERTLLDLAVILVQVASTPTLPQKTASTVLLEATCRIMDILTALLAAIITFPMQDQPIAAVAAMR